MKKKLWKQLKTEVVDTPKKLSTVNFIYVIVYLVSIIFYNVQEVNCLYFIFLYSLIFAKQKKDLLLDVHYLNHTHWLILYYKTKACYYSRRQVHKIN